MWHFLWTQCGTHQNTGELPPMILQTHLFHYCVWQTSAIIQPVTLYRVKQLVPPQTTRNHMQQAGRVFIIFHCSQQFLVQIHNSMLLLQIHNSMLLVQRHNSMLLVQIHNSMLVKQPRHNFMQVCHMVQSSTWICWPVPYHRLKCPACYQCALMSLNFSPHFWLYVTCEAITWMPTILNCSLPMSGLKKPLKSPMFSPWHCHQNLFWVFHTFPMQSFRVLDKN